MEILGAIAIVIGIVAGTVQVIDYIEKRRKKKATLDSPEVSTQLPTPPAVHKRLQNERGHNLPSQLTSLVGRNQEIYTAESLLRNGGVRLLTLTGPGGIGKTRLCLQVAHNLIDYFEDGVFFVSLSTIRDYSLVAPTIAKTLEISETEDQSVFQRLIGYFREKQILLILDNFEQLVEAAPKLTELLAQCPQLKLLVTSRIVLRITGEHEFKIPPLTVPDLQHLPPFDGLVQCEAVQLFVERAQAAKIEFSLTNKNAQTVAEICTRLDGLPLAIELAAACIKYLPPWKILERLDNRLALLTTGMRDMSLRQQTLEATIAWSYEMLYEWEKILFARLSVFVNGFTIDAANAVIAATDENEKVFEGVASLVDKSLLQHHQQTDGEPRFWMFETIREYGQKYLRASGDAEKIQKRHTEFFLGLAEQAEPNLLGKEQMIWFNRLEQDHNNLRAALDWSISHEEVEKSLRLSSALGLFWSVRGYLAEGQIWFEKVLARSGNEHKMARAKALRMAAFILPTQGEFIQAKTLYEESLTLARDTGDELGIALTLNFIGLLNRRQGEYEQARMRSEEARFLFKKLGYESGMAWSQLVLADIALGQGIFNQAMTLFEDSRDLFCKLKDKRGIAASLDGFGNVAKYEGDYVRARSFYRESMSINRELGNKIREAIVIASLGEIALFQNDHTEAKSLCKKALYLFQDLGDRRGVGRVFMLLGNVAFAQGKYTQAEELYQKSLAIMVAIEDKRYLARNLLELGKVKTTQGQLREAVRLLAIGSNILDNIGSVLTSFDRDEFERSLSILKTGLSKETFESAWSRGYEMTLENAVEFAISLGQDDSHYA